MFPRNSFIALLPAAGAATRFGGKKQLAKLNDKTLLTHVIENCRAGGCQRVYVITGDSQEVVSEEAKEHNAIVIHHEKWTDGMSSSVNFGLEKLMEIPDWDRVFILPSDMPWFSGTWIRIMANKVARLVDEPRQAIATDYSEGPGLPAILSRAFIEHCYFASPNKNLRKSIAEFPELKIIPSGPHTKDVDYREDLLN